MKKCDCYRERSVTFYNGIFGMQNYLEGYCVGTKECDACNCGGDESKCDFYPEKRKKNEKMLNTAEMWLKAQENNKTYLVEQGTVAYSKSKGLFYVSDHSLCDLINFKEWSINDFFNLKWAEIPEKTMTRTEAEKQLGIKIVG